MTQAFGQT